MEAVFTMHANITVTGQYVCSSADLKYFQVSGLATPLGTCKNSLLRSSDVIAIDFKAQPNLLSNPVVISEAISQECVLQSQ